MLAVVIAAWGTTASAAAQNSAKEVWWSLRPLERPTQPGPEVRSPGSSLANPIDAFIRAKLAEHGLEPSPEADRRTLARRLFFDLTGLPPTPEEVAAFVADEEPHAYEKLVDRLLASPRYGEHWARHWLDVANYADTHGNDHDFARPNAWPLSRLRHPRAQRRQAVRAVRAGAGCRRCALSR